MAKKTKVIVLFGGKSAEHEISIASAKNVVAALDRKKYEVLPVAIDKDGKWHIFDERRLLTGASLDQLQESSSEVAVLADKTSSKLVNISKRSDAAEAMGVVFPVLHGTYGEDGAIQGFLKSLNVPFVGSGVLGSAVGMDKDVMKRLLRDASIKTAQFLVFAHPQKDAINYHRIVKKLGLPLFVKPANLGSSVGINKVKSELEFDYAVRDAFQYDSKILIEEYIHGREIECSVLGNEQPIVSLPGEVIPRHEFYSYAAKYLDEHGAQLKIPAELPNKVVAEVQKVAIRVFRVLGLEGMARVDFFLKPDGELVLNEVNTIPGFTDISMYPKLWEASGISYSELLDRLIQLAVERHRSERQLKTAYEPPPKDYLMPGVPFYSQSWDLKHYQEYGFQNIEEAEYWKKSSCGALCLKMAIDGLDKRNVDVPIGDYVRRGVSLGSYDDATGWKHQGLVRLAESFGLKAKTHEYVNEATLRDMLLSRVLPIISIRWAFENDHRTWREYLFFWKRFGGHMALVVGFEEEYGIKGFYVHHTSTRSEYNWQYKFVPLHKFRGGFTGRCIAVSI